MAEPKNLFYCPGSLLLNEFDVNHPVAWGMPASWPIFFESDQAYRLRPGFGSQATVAARYPREQILQSGWLLGEEYLEDQANVVAFQIGEGYVVTYGSQIDFRTQPRATFKLLFKVVWRYIPDPATAAAALAAGEVDWWEIPPLDFVPKIEQNADPGDVPARSPRHPGLAAPEPPASAVQQQEGPAGAGRHDGPGDCICRPRSAQPKYYRTCHSVFACNGPYATKAGAEGLAKQNLERARQLVKESGYDGRPVTVVHVTDIAFLSRRPRS